MLPGTCSARFRGHVKAETGFKLRSAPDVVRAPDAAFVRTDRLPPAGEGYAEVAPDLVAEVVSPADTAHEIDQKVAEYLEAGVRSVWVLYPRTQTILIHRDEGVLRPRAGGVIENEPALPGFRCAVDDLFAESGEGCSWWGSIPPSPA